jgi:hypothetical protein
MPLPLASLNLTPETQNVGSHEALSSTRKPYARERSLWNPWKHPAPQTESTAVGFPSKFAAAVSQTT